MNHIQRKQLKEARKKLIDLDKSTGDIAADLGAAPSIISQLFYGHNYYPRYAEEIFERYGIVIPDTRETRARLLNREFRLAKERRDKRMSEQKSYSLKTFEISADAMRDIALVQHRALTAIQEQKEFSLAGLFVIKNIAEYASGETGRISAKAAEELRKA